VNYFYTVFNAKKMTTIVQFDYDDLQVAIKQCLLETLNEFKNLPVTPELPDRCSISQAAEMTGLSRSALYKLTMKGGIPYEKYGRRLVFSRKELTVWMEERTVKKQSLEDIVTERLAKVTRKKMSTKTCYGDGNKA
jgi:excisionase family DNA binding protein